MTEHLLTLVLPSTRLAWSTIGLVGGARDESTSEQSSLSPANLVSLVDLEHDPASSVVVG